MHRLRLLLAALALFSFVAVAPASAQSETPGDNQPAVVVEEVSGDAEEAAWTFRFLVPTLVGASGLIILGVVLGYGLRVRGRYRVTQ